MLRFAGTTLAKLPCITEEPLNTKLISTLAVCFAAFTTSVAGAQSFDASLLAPRQAAALQLEAPDLSLDRQAELDSLDRTIRRTRVGTTVSSLVLTGGSGILAWGLGFLGLCDAPDGDTCPDPAAIGIAAAGTAIVAASIVGIVISGKRRRKAKRERSRLLNPEVALSPTGASMRLQF